MPTEIADVRPDQIDLMRSLAKEPGRENVEAFQPDLDAMPEAAQPADVLWLHLFHHDLHTALIQKKGATAANFNRPVYERLKPGGACVIVDHAAAAGSGTNDTPSLHRIDPASVREEAEAAGFVLAAESTMLANKLVATVGVRSPLLAYRPSEANQMLRITSLSALYVLTIGTLFAAYVFH